MRSLRDVQTFGISMPAHHLSAYQRNHVERINAFHVNQYNDQMNMININFDFFVYETAMIRQKDDRIQDIILRW